MVQFAKVCSICLLASLALRGVAKAQDAGDCPPDPDAGICDGGSDDAGFYGGGAVDGGSAAPLACNGALCDTTNGSGCSTAGSPVNLGWIAVILAALALPFARRRIARRPPGTERSQ